MPLWKRKFGITTVLTATFGGLVALSTGTLLFLSLSTALETTRNTLGSRLQYLIDEAAQKSLTYFQPMENQARWLAQEIVAGKIDPENPVGFKAVLTGAVSTLPQIAGISFQYPDGTGFFYQSSSATLQRVEWPQNWRVRLNRNEKNPQTAPPEKGVWVLRPSVLDGKPATTFIAPARTPNGDIGVVAVRVNLNPLSKLLATNAEYRGHKLVRFILFNNRVVIGHPMLPEFDEVIRPTIDDLDDPFLKQIDQGERYPLRIVGEIPHVETFALQTDQGQRIFATMTDTSRQAGGELLVGVHFDPSAAEAEVNRLLTVFIIGILLLIGSVILAFFLGRRAAAPMKQLADAAQLVQNDKLDEVTPLPVSSVKELASATSAFNGMVDGLKERVKIRDLFGKYVPQNVATLLLTDDTTAQPKNAEATVLFLDIEGFSSISEKLSPAKVVATMNAFFSEAVNLIEEEDGMVTQFQGDAILAVFNVPVPQENHAAAAVRAGLSIIDNMKQNKYAGQTLNCRIGINTGPLVAGAIGAQDRLSYTVYGDAVNVASRLEQMNKEFDTRILMTQATVDLVEDLPFEQIGTLPIRGRNAPVDVYTVVS
ncbi:MAG: adenylate/guanylate cyclase domain-containing protein [Rhizobiaceae bacterium]